jgi:hypothetical protein
MGRELGRISGPLLADNLKRNGANLAFDNKVLFLDVVNKRIGFNTATPVTDLYTPTAINTVNLLVDNSADIGSFIVSGHTIQNVLNSPITISPSQAVNPTIVTPGLSTANLYLYGNTLLDTVSNDSITITANSSGAINLNNDVLITGNLHATGDITWDGNITFGNNLTQDTVTFDAEINSAIKPSANNVDDLGSDPATGGNAWANTYVNNINTPSISTTNLSTTSFTGSGTNGLNGNVIIGTTGANTLTVNADIISDLVPAATNTYDLGSASLNKFWTPAFFNTFTDGNISANSNSITATSTNSNLQLSTSGTGKVVFSSLNLTNNATVGNTVGVTGTASLDNTITGAITQTGDFNQTGNSAITGNLVAAGTITYYGTNRNFGNFTISGNTIAGRIANDTVYYLANGSGNVWLGNDIKINGTNIINNFGYSSTTLFSEDGQILITENGIVYSSETAPVTSLQDSLLFKPSGSGNVVINSTNSVILPIGNDGNFALTANGQIRFNSTNLNIEGYSNTGYVNFFNLYSQNYKTNVTAESAPGVGDNALRFKTNNNVIANITSTKLSANSAIFGNISINNNVITNISSTTNTVVTPSGTGVINVNGTEFDVTNGNTITNTSNGPFILSSTGNGRIKFGGTYGLDIPYGDSTSYPPNPELGTIRYNTDTNVEVYNGTDWVPAYGTSSAISATEVEDLNLVYTIVLGF